MAAANRRPARRPSTGRHSWYSTRNRKGYDRTWVNSSDAFEERLKPLIFLAVVGAGIVALRLTVFRPKLVPVTVQRVETGRGEDFVVNAGPIVSDEKAGA